MTAKFLATLTCIFSLQSYAQIRMAKADVTIHKLTTVTLANGATSSTLDVVCTQTVAVPVNDRRNDPAGTHSAYVEYHCNSTLNNTPVAISFSPEIVFVKMPTNSGQAPDMKIFAAFNQLENIDSSPMDPLISAFPSVMASFADLAQKQVVISSSQPQYTSCSGSASSDPNTPPSAIVCTVDRPEAFAITYDFKD